MPRVIKKVMSRPLQAIVSGFSIAYLGDLGNLVRKSAGLPKRRFDRSAQKERRLGLDEIS